jgi:predicted dehydrogenase
MYVGVIGAGVMGKRHLRVYSEMKSVDSLAVYDNDSKVTIEASEKYNAIAYSTLTNLLNDVDAVSICVPTQYHFNVANQVFRQHVHALIEKPICSSFNEAKNLIKNIPIDSIVGVGHIERFNPVVDEIYKIIKDPLYIELKRHNPTSSRITGTSVVEDLMIHDIDIVINKFFSIPASVHAVGNDDVCSVIMRCGDIPMRHGNVPVVLSASRKSSKKIRKMYIECEEFTVEGDFMSQEVTIYRKPGKYQFESERYMQENIIEKVIVNKVEPLKVELTTFIECVKKESPFPITPKQAMMNLYLCEAINTALRG